jgi:hypothetical protein
MLANLIEHDPEPPKKAAHTNKRPPGRKGSNPQDAAFRFEQT